MVSAMPGTQGGPREPVVTPNTVLRRGNTWQQFADGRVWRLKRGRHFAGDLRVAAAEATRAAAEMGLAVRVLRDDFGKYSYIWVQFADAEIPLGAPCPRCDSRRIVQTHEHYGRCPVCGTTFVFKGRLAPEEPREDVEPEGPEGEEPPVEPTGDAIPRQLGDEVRGGTAEGDAPASPALTARTLEFFDDVELRLLEADAESETWYGHGWTPVGIHALLLVRFLLGPDGERLPHPYLPGASVTRVRAFPAWPFARALDLDRLFPPDGEDPPVPPPVARPTELS